MNIKHREGEKEENESQEATERKKTEGEKVEQEQRRHQGRVCGSTDEQPPITISL